MVTGNVGMNMIKHKKFCDITEISWHDRCPACGTEGRDFKYTVWTKTDKVKIAYYWPPLLLIDSDKVVLKIQHILLPYSHTFVQWSLEILMVLKCFGNNYFVKKNYLLNCVKDSELTLIWLLLETCGWNILSFTLNRRKLNL